MPLTDIQRDELENDLIELEELIEKETNMEELKILCQRKVGILTRLWKYKSLFDKDHKCPLIQ